MTTDDPDDELPPGSDDDMGVDSADAVDESPTERTREELRKTKERLGEGADKAVRGFDDNIVDLLSWLLDTETRARIYVYLRDNPDSTSDEVADGTGLYPSTVREALAELHDEETVKRDKREASGAGNNPYEYEAIAPSELVQGVVGDVQRELNAVFNLDRRLGGESPDGDTEPVQISVGDDGGVDDNNGSVDDNNGSVDDGNANDDGNDGNDESVDGDESSDGDEDADSDENDTDRDDK